VTQMTMTMCAAPREDHAIDVREATKRYGSTLGVSNVSFAVRNGEILGLLGPNGSGKTTLLRMMLGLISITSGSISIFGRDVESAGPDLRESIGYLPGNIGLYDQQTVWQYLGFIAALRRLNLDVPARSLCERFDLDPSRRIGELSRGMKQKVAVIQAFMHAPDVLLLDEPTSGLDPLVQREFEALVDETRLRGATIVLSSHVLAEVERLADRVAVMRDGRVAVIDDVSMLKSRFARRIDLEFPTRVDPKPFATLAGVSDVQVTQHLLTCNVVGAETDLLRLAVEHGVVGVHTHDPSLNEIFLRIVGTNDTGAN